MCNGMTLSYVDNSPVTLRYDPPPHTRITKVRFYINGTKSKPKDETGSPYAMMGKRNHTYNAWVLKPGTCQLSVEAYCNHVLIQVENVTIYISNGATATN
jgi:hypothetical protein